MSGSVDEIPYRLVVEPLDTTVLRKTFQTFGEKQVVDVAKNCRIENFGRDTQKWTVVPLFAQGFHFGDLQLRVKDLSLARQIVRVAVTANEIDLYRRAAPNDVSIFLSNDTSFVLPLVSVLIKEVFVSDRVCIEFDVPDMHLNEGDVSIEWHLCDVSMDACKKFTDYFYTTSLGAARKEITWHDLHDAVIRSTNVTRLHQDRLMVGENGHKREWPAARAVELRNILYDSSAPRDTTKRVVSEDVVNFLVYAHESELLEICRNVPHRIAPIDPQWENLVFFTSPPSKDVQVLREHAEAARNYLNQYAAFYKATFTMSEVEKTAEEIAADVRRDVQSAEFAYACYLFLRSGGEPTEQIQWQSTGTAEPPLPYRYESTVWQFNEK
jgi:hypothetical protein